MERVIQVGFHGCEPFSQLCRQFEVVPLAGSAEVPVPRGNDLGQGWGPWFYGSRFMDANASRYFDLFLLARLVALLAGLGCGALVFAWVRELFGVRAAALSTTVFFLLPMVLAHAHLATVDMGCTLTVLLTAYLARRALLRPRCAQTLHSFLGGAS